MLHAAGQLTACDTSLPPSNGTMREAATPAIDGSAAKRLLQAFAYTRRQAAGAADHHQIVAVKAEIDLPGA